MSALARLEAAPVRGGRARTTLLTVGLALGLLAAMLPATQAGGPYPGETTVFTDVPAPGAPEGIVVDDGVAYVGTHTPVYGTGTLRGPSHVFGFDLDTGDLVADIEIEDQRTDQTHGLLGMTVDADGNLYVLDRNPARLLRIDPSTGSQATYATFPDLAPCSPVSEAPCSPTEADHGPVPDGIVFDGTGNAYVTDLEQASIYRVPPGGGAAEIYFQDPRLDSPFGPNGIDIGPDGDLYVAMTGSMEPSVFAKGLIYTLPLEAAPATPASEELEVFYTFETPAAGPDGIRFSSSGYLYVALAGLSQISAIAPDGTEAFRFPGLVTNHFREVPYDMPASLAFDDARQSLLITNHAYFTGNEDHWVVLRAQVLDTGLDRARPDLT